METVEGNLSKGMRHLNGLYTQRLNRRHNRVGHIFQGRYKSILVDRDSYLLELCRYVVLNPVRAGMVKHVGGYKWSNYGATAGVVKTPPFLSVDWILAQFGKKRLEARRAYRRFVQSGIKAPCPWDELKAQCILGKEAFIEKLKPVLKDKSKLMEIPKRERLAFRPSLKELLDKKKVKSRGDRSKAIVKANFEYGYTLAEIGKYLGVHYTTISKIIKGQKS